jgi:hypothetical protein
MGSDAARTPSIDLEPPPNTPLRCAIYTFESRIIQ